MRFSLPTILMVASCSSSPLGRPSACPADSILVAASNYSSSEVGSFSLDGSISLFSGTELGGDPVLAHSAGRNFFINRDPGGAIFELDPCGQAIASFSPINSGEMMNVDPYDVAVLPDGSLFIPRFSVPSALVISKDGATRKTIDMSTFDTDGNPELSAAVSVTLGGVAKIATMMERLERLPDKTLVPKQTALIAMVDATSLTVDKTVDLGVRNPFGHIVVENDSTLWLAASGDVYSATDVDAGIVRFDLPTLTSTIVIPETMLGASVIEVAVSDGCGAAIVADASMNNRTSLVSFNARAGTLGKTVIPPTPDFDLRGLAFSGNVLLVGDRRPQSGKGYAAHVMTRGDECDLTATQSADIFFKYPPLAFQP